VGGLLATQPGAHEDVHEAGLPLDLAPTPSSPARRWFASQVLDEQLEQLIGSQQADGGFEVLWLIWTSITGFEWRGIQTLEHLKTLRAYGRLLTD